MSTSGHPGIIYKAECVANNAAGMVFVGEGVSIVLNGDKVEREYYHVGKSYIVHFSPADGGEPHGSDKAAPAR